MKKGFTIVELLVVIVVIAILVALTLPSLFGLQARARDTDRKNDVKNIQTALASYNNDNGSYPDALADLQTANLLSADSLEDRQGNAYTYAVTPTGCDGGTTTDCTSYTVTADLENDDDPDADTAGNYVRSATGN